MSKERVNHPDHYNAGGVECIDALDSATAGLEGIEAFDTANAIKYLWRWKHKNGIEDLKKAIWYIQHLVDKLSEEERKTKVHLCNTCIHDFPQCEAKCEDITFGTGLGNDNVYMCKSYMNKQAPHFMDALMYAQELFSVKPILVKVPDGVDIDEFIKNIIGGMDDANS